MANGANRKVDFAFCETAECGMESGKPFGLSRFDGVVNVSGQAFREPITSFGKVGDFYAVGRKEGLLQVSERFIER